MIENGTKTDHLERLGGQGPKWPKMVPKLTIWSVWAARARTGRKWYKTDHLERLGGQGPKWSK